jgi:hypothetical protein
MGATGIPRRTANRRSDGSDSRAAEAHKGRLTLEQDLQAKPSDVDRRMARGGGIAPGRAACPAFLP